MCSTPKTQQAQKPKQSRFSHSDLSFSQMASFAAVANAAQARREQREQHRKASATPAESDTFPQTRSHHTTSPIARRVRLWLRRALLA